MLPNEVAMQNKRVAFKADTIIKIFQIWAA
jgi:hypothetical protein